MTNSTYIIPFTCQIGELGLSEAHGLMKFSSKTGLSLEFQVKDAFIGLIKSEVREVFLGWDDIADIQVKKKWFSAIITIRVNKMSLFEKLPGSISGEFTAKIKKEDVETARNMQSSTLLILSEKKIEQLDQLHED
jgi:hypothetical protein